MAKANPECVALFLYHRADEATLLNLRQFNQHNPQIPIVGLAYEGAQELRGVPCHFTPKPREGVVEFEANEERVYDWFNNAVVPADRYLLIEWDTLVTVDVKDWFGAYWDAPVAVGGSVMWPHRDPWVWWNQANDRLPPELSQSLCGITPLSGILYSHDALAAVTAQWLKTPCPHAFCELRAGTLMRAAGLTPQQRVGGNLTCVHDGRLVRSDWRVVPGFYHPVKADPTARESPPAGWKEDLGFADQDFEGHDPVLQVLRRLTSALEETGQVPTHQKAVAAYHLAKECLRLNDDPRAVPSHHSLAKLRRAK